MKRHELGSRDCPVCGDEEMSEDIDDEYLHYSCPSCGLEIVYDEIDFWSSPKEGVDEDGWKLELTLYRRKTDGALWVIKEELKSEGDDGWHGYEDYYPITMKDWRETTGK